MRRRIFAAISVLAIAYGGWRIWDGNRGFYTQEITFENRGARLAATLYLPERPGKVPGIVWMHGSGPATRGPIGLSFGRYFARKGYAFLVFDKRGIGESGGKYGGGTAREICPENFDLLASDGAAALELLTRRPEVLADQVGFVGGSQAGWITPRAAVMSGKAAFMLLITAPVNTAQEIVRLENLRIGPPGGVDAAKAFSAFRPGGRDVPEGMDVDEAFNFAQKRPISFPCPDFDPLPDLLALDVPGLWLLGKDDWIVPSGHTIEKLETLRKLGKPYEYMDLPGANHALLFAPKNRTVDAMDSWLAKVTMPAS